MPDYNVASLLQSNTSVLPAPHVLEEEALEFDWNVKLPLIVLGVVVTVWDSVALVSIVHAKRTPQVVRFLSAALISFEILSLVAFTIRKVLLDIFWNDTALVVGSHLVLLSFITVGLMSTERLVLFTSNRIYIQHLRTQTFKRISIATWLSFSLIYYVTRYVVCNITAYETCAHNMKVAFGLVIFIVIVLSTCCYLRIFFLLRNKKTSPPSTAYKPNRSIQKLRTTCLMFMFLLVTLVGFLLFVYDLILEPDTRTKKLQFDLFSLFNCTMDPCLYVWWFRECRMNLLKIPALCIPSVKKRTEKMKIDLFDIVTFKTRETINLCVV